MPPAAGGHPAPPGDRNFRVDGKVAIVTGSSRGIGLAIASSLARAGAHVIVSSRKADACEEAAASLRAEGLQATAIPCHAGRAEDLARITDACIARFGRLDICVANAAANPVFGPLDALPDDAWDKVMDVNLRSVFRLAKLTGGHLAAGGGTFIAISSVGAYRTEHGIGAYNVSKLALIGLVRNLASEWGPRGVRVNAIAPGLIRTDLSRALWQDASIAARVEKLVPLGRIGDADDIGAIALFLAAPASRYVTGQTIVADGGSTLVSAVNPG